MRNDPEFNVELVTLVEKHPSVYNQWSTDYANKNIQEKSWKTIARQLSANVADCKKRWKNLRGCYTRYLRSSLINKRNTAYYLAEHLDFLRPFTKTRLSNDRPNTGGSPFELEQRQEEDIIYYPEFDHLKEEEEDEDVNIDFDNEPEADMQLDALETVNMPTETKRSRIFKQESELQYFQSKRVSSTDKGDNKVTQDPDLAFMISVLPDMKEMNNEQKRRFKIGILNLVGDILE